MLTSRTTAPLHRRVATLLALALFCGPVLPALAQQAAPVAQGAPTQVTPAPAAQAPAPATAAPVAPAAGLPAAPAPSAAVPAGSAPVSPAPTVTDTLVPPMPGTTITGSPVTDTATAGSGPAAPVDGAPVEAAPAGAEDASVAAQLPHDLSPWGMFMAADLVVKAVMIGLAFASVVTWTVWLAKSLELLVASGRLRRALRGFLSSASLDAARAVGAAGPAGAMLKVTDLELQRSGDLPAEGIKERVSISLSRIEVGAGRAITRGTGLLATIGATAPFVGLFGTVWGIMNSFIGISKAQTTNLAVVAPGIAEALLATAIGLVAAIPAVVIYNHFSRQVSGYRVLMGDASAEVLRLLSRDLDKRDAIARHAVEARQGHAPSHGHPAPHGAPVSAVRVRAAAE